MTPCHSWPKVRCISEVLLICERVRALIDIVDVWIWLFHMKSTCYKVAFAPMGMEIFCREFGLVTKECVQCMCGHLNQPGGAHHLAKHNESALFATAIQTSMLAMVSKEWEVRNAACLAYASSVVRALGYRNIQAVRPAPPSPQTYFPSTLWPKRRLFWIRLSIPF